MGKSQRDCKETTTLSKVHFTSSKTSASPSSKFIRASLRGWREYLSIANLAIAKLNPALSPQWMQFTYVALRGGHFVDGENPSGAQLGQMEPARWTTLYKQLVDLKVIETEFDPATAYTLQFVHAN